MYEQRWEKRDADNSWKKNAHYTPPVSTRRQLDSIAVTWSLYEVE